MKYETKLNRRDLVGLAKLVLIELEKISTIFDEVFAKCEADRVQNKEI